MSRYSFPIVMVLAFLASGVGPCQRERLTSAEAKEALDEAALSNQALSLISGTVEITTNFTIGQAVEAAAEELREFILSQLPCAEIILNGNTLSVEYGVNPGNCTYNGNTYSGIHTITITSASIGNLQVDHEWIDFSNGQLSVSGTANVTWSAADSSRHVVHELDWMRFSDNKTATGSGDRTQTALPEGVAVGINVDGYRDWVSGENEWLLDIDNVEMRWEDPVPQSGTYTLDTPFDKTLSLSFVRIDEDTIQVTISSGDDSFSFNVSQAGVVSES